MADVDVPLSFDDDYYALGLAIWELWKGERVFQDLDTLEAEIEFVIHGVVVDVDEVEDLLAIDTIWKLLEYGGRGTVKRDKGFRYKVTGSAFESMNNKILNILRSSRRDGKDGTWLAQDSHS